MFAASQNQITRRYNLIVTSAVAEPGTEIKIRADRFDSKTIELALRDAWLWEPVAFLKGFDGPAIAIEWRGRK
jgi:hypothetical protein